MAEEKEKKAKAEKDMEEVKVSETVKETKKKGLSKEDIIAAIETMTVLEVADLVKALEEKFGVSAAAMMAAPAAATGGAEAAVVEEQTEFAVNLKSVGAQKIQVIKEVRTITGLGLKEAKDLVDGAPNTVKEKITKEEAEKIKAHLEGVGAEADFK